jgi:hypothetical protein
LKYPKCYEQQNTGGKTKKQINMILNKLPYFKILAKFLFEKMKASAKNPRLRGQTLGRNKDRLVTATEDDIFKLLIKYDGRCCKTNVIFPLVNCKSHCTQWKNFGFNPMSVPSVDRIDSNIDYTPDNIQIVTLAYNKAKGEYSQFLADEYYNNPIKTHKIYSKQKIKNYNMANKIQNDLLKHLISIGEVDMAEEYFKSRIQKSEMSVDSTGNIQTKKTENKPTSKHKKPTHIKDDYIKNKSKKVTQFTNDYQNLSDLFLNQRGRIDVKRLTESKLATLITEKRIPVFRLEKGKGHVYGIKKSDVVDQILIEVNKRK